MASKSGFKFRNLFSPGKNKEEKKDLVDVPANSTAATTHKIPERRTAPRDFPAKGTKVLVVEDSKTVQMVLNKMFSEAGFEVLQAFDGQSGVAMAQLHRPSLIMMDVVMPGMTGFQATRAIRKDSEISKIPIIIMSGNQQATEQFWANKIGANEYMTKPFSRADLFRVVEEQLTLGSAEAGILQSDASGEYIQPDESYELQKWQDI